MGSSASRDGSVLDGAGADAQDGALRVKLALTGLRRETCVGLAQWLMARRVCSPAELRGGLEFEVHETAVDGQAVRLQLWGLS